ncbi:hypothetical protein AG1IA_02947 [Rhizoctonia solani AG-1 IA]|uniref:Uncharacterized protein n=1 Tax=Thanatephorus cucumeris (strain AG1-IA) TaxID=983506 RepID=L8X1X5_THACA|nr:hypothetical protein AG1IA_02947 [Rhizoctonia solani AG-1 IA]
MVVRLYISCTGGYPRDSSKHWASNSFDVCAALQQAEEI